MCLACEEMDLYFAYLEQEEAAKRAAKVVGDAEPAPAALDVSLPAVSTKAYFVCEDPVTR